MSAKSCAMQNQLVKHLSMEFRTVEGINVSNLETAIYKVETILLGVMVSIGILICISDTRAATMVRWICLLDETEIC